jgi:chloramphenicol-sensitive protein RarD
MSVDGARHSGATRGAVYAVAAYASWGLLPIYWKALARVPLLELLAHRVWLSSIFALLLLGTTRQVAVARDALAAPPIRRALVATSALIALNWGLFIGTVARGDVLAASLGYFLNPLVNVALGVTFLRERLRPWQGAAVGVAAFGVAVLAFAAGGLPWVSLVLALSFGLYGLLRKAAPVAPVVSLAVETTLLAPIAVGYLLWLHVTGEAGLGRLPAMSGLLVAVSGVVTAMPLLWFAAAAQRLRLSTLGLFQYLAPTGHLLLAVGIYHEPFAAPQLLAFGCVWAGLLLYSVDSARGAREAARLAGNRAASGVHPSIEIT